MTQFVKGFGCHLAYEIVLGTNLGVVGWCYGDFAKGGGWPRFSVIKTFGTDWAVT